jgi:hypothetical protein
LSCMCSELGIFILVGISSVQMGVYSVGGPTKV